MNSVKAKLLTKETLEDLYIRQRKTQTEIGKLFGLTGSAILYWRNKFGISTVKKSRQLLLSPSPALSYVLGVLRGDGFTYVQSTSKRSFVILSVVDSLFAQAFLHSLSNLGLNSKWVAVKAQRKGWNPQVRVYAESEEFVLWYRKLSLKKERALIKAFPLDFLRGVYDSEGTIVWGNSEQLFELSMVTTSKVTKDLIVDELNVQGWKASVTCGKLSSGKDRFMMGLYRTSDIQRFLCFVQPSIKVLPRSENMLIPSQAKQGTARKV